MEKVNALKLRQSFGKVLKHLVKRHEPILIEKAHKPVAILLSIKFFNERFFDYQEVEKRKKILKLARKTARLAPENSLQIIRELRYGEDS